MMPKLNLISPISGGYIHFAERWLNPGVGFALGWQAVFSNVVGLPTELISASILLSFWDTGKFRPKGLAFSDCGT